MLKCLAIVAFMLLQPTTANPQNAIRQKDTVAKHGRDRTSNHGNPATPPTALPDISAQDASAKPDSNKPNADAQGGQWSLSDKIAIGATIAGFLQFFALIATIWTMHRFGRRQMRAYFGTPEGKLCILADGNVEPRVTFKNCGQTPAYELEVETCGRFESRGDQYPPPRRRPALYPHPHIVGGGSPYHFTCDPVQSGREKDVLLNDLALGQLAFRLYGKCTYRDAFKDPHFIDFQLFVGGGAIVQYTIDPDKGSLAMLTDSKGNSAD
jgi:hypothetical protein